MPKDKRAIGIPPETKTRGLSPREARALAGDLIIQANQAERGDELTIPGTGGSVIVRQVEDLVGIRIEPGSPAEILLSPESAAALVQAIQG